MNTTKYLLSILGGIVVTACLYAGGSMIMADKAAKIEHTDVITTSGGMQVKLGKVKAELVQTGIQVGSGSHIIVGLTEAPARLDQIIRKAGGDTTSMLTGDLTVCLGTIAVYNSELNGVVSAPVHKECRNFTKGQMFGTVITFAEDYTVQAKTIYETKYSFINKGSK